MFYDNLFTGHWQPLHEAANIPVYGATHYQRKWGQLYFSPLLGLLPDLKALMEDWEQ
jgi:hypothetical protein